MGKETISNIQGISMVILFIGGSTYVLGTAGEAGPDLWLAIIIAILFSLVIIRIYSRILSQFPRRNLFQILEDVFGRVIGKIISLLYIWYFFHLTSLVLTNFGEYVNVLQLEDTPKVIIEIAFMLLAIWIVKSGVEVLGRWAALFVIFILFTQAIATSLTIPVMNMNNLRPFLNNGIRPVLKGAFSTFSFPLAETIAFMALFDSLKNNKSSYKVYNIGIIIGGLSIFATSVVDMLVLGKQDFNNLYFLSYATLSRIKFPGSIERIEVGVATSIIVAGFIKISVFLLASCKGISNLFNTDDYRFIVTIIGIFSIILSFIVYDSTMAMVEWGINVYNYYAFVFQVILPIILLIGIEIKIRLRKRKKLHRN